MFLNVINSVNIYLNPRCGVKISGAEVGDETGGGGDGGHSAGAALADIALVAPSHRTVA